MKYSQTYTFGWTGGRTEGQSENIICLQARLSTRRKAMKHFNVWHVTVHIWPTGSANVGKFTHTHTHTLTHRISLLDGSPPTHAMRRNKIATVDKQGSLTWNYTVIVLAIFIRRWHFETATGYMLHATQTCPFCSPYVALCAYVSNLSMTMTMINREERRWPDDKDTTLTLERGQWSS